MYYDPQMHTHAKTTFAPPTPERLDDQARLISLAFSPTVEQALAYIQTNGVENYRLLTRDGTPVGGLLNIPMGHFFGSRSVPCWGVAAVAIDPAHRGTGVATDLMRHAVLEMHDQNVAISTLYPATQALYRRAGYEQAGHLFRATINLEELRASARGSSDTIDRHERVAMRTATDDDKGSIERAQRRLSALIDGHTDRPPSLWQRIYTPFEQRAANVYVTDTADPEAWILYTTARDAVTQKIRAAIHEMGALTTRGARALWTFLSGLSSTIPTATWHTGPAHPLLMIPAEQAYELTFVDHWMLRVVNVPRALESRGYAAHVRAQLHIKIRDPIIERNNRSFVIDIGDSLAEVHEGGRGDMELDIGAFAAMYTGYLPPTHLELAGRLEATPAAMEAAGAIFAPTAGPPCMVEKF